MFDKSLFLNNTEPWPNQVFSKDFDCYFFVNYPHLQYGQEGPCRPYDLSNNLSEKTIYVTNPEGTKSFNYKYEFKNGDWNFDGFNKLFDSKVADERFLFWSGEGERWAMISDKKYGVAVYGINWKDANQIPMFFDSELLSPIHFLQKVEKEKHLDIFIKNYQPSKILIEGSDENSIWVKYYFQCHVNTENDKLFYWQNFEKLYHCITKLLSHYKAIDMYADQAFQRNYFMNKQWYRSYKQAPVGGYQKFNLKNCEKVATKFLLDNEHLKLSFEMDKDGADKLYKAKKEGLINFFGFSISGSTQKQQRREYRNDFTFGMGLYDHGDKSDKYNQNFQLSYKKSTIENDKMNVAIDELKKIGFAVKVSTVEQPATFVKYSTDKPLVIEGIQNVIPDGVKELIMKHIEKNNQ